MSSHSDVRHWERMYSQVGDPLPWELGSVPPEIATWARLIPNAGTVLDIGCGRGFHALSMGQLGFMVTGIDISATAIAAANATAQARQLRNVVFEQADIVDYRSGASFDFVYDYSTFHHVHTSDRLAYIDNVISLLNAGGFFGLVCYSLNDGDARGQSIRIGRYGNSIAHFSKDELATLFAIPFIIDHYNETLLGRKHNHTAHHFIFRKRP